MLPMSLSFCFFVVFTNFSLQYNSVGAYQCLKALTTPGVMIISIFYYKQSYSTKVKLTVVSIMHKTFHSDSDVYDFCQKYFSKIL